MTDLFFFWEPNKFASGKQNREEPARSIMPKVTIIVPTYNYAHLIGETISGLRAQTFIDWQCLIVDDGSTDSTAETVTALAAGDNRITYIPRPHQGPSPARNAGLAAAAGRYIQFLDADDILEPSKLERQAKFLDDHLDVDIVYSDVRYFRDDDPEERTLSWDGGNHDWTRKMTASGEEAIAALLAANITTIHAPLVRRTLLEKIGGFDTQMTDAEDWDLWLRCALAGGKFHYQEWPHTLALVRSHRGSTSRNRARMLQAQIYMRRKVHEALSPELRAVNQSALKAAEFRLRTEKALEESTSFRRFRRLLKVGASSGSPRNLAYALALPLARNPIIKGKVAGVLGTVRRPKQ